MKIRWYIDRYVHTLLKRYYDVQTTNTRINFCQKYLDMFLMNILIEKKEGMMIFWVKFDNNTSNLVRKY